MNTGENDILEMESVGDTDEFDGDVRLDMIDEEVGERTTLFLAAPFVVVVVVVTGTCLDFVHVLVILGKSHIRPNKLWESFQHLIHHC